MRGGAGRARFERKEPMNRKTLGTIALASFLAIAVAAPAQAQWTLQGQQYVVDANAGKLPKKKRGPVNSLFVDVITNYAGSGTGFVDRKANRTKLYFPTDFAFQTRGLAQCDPNAGNFGDSTTTQAKELCGRAQVGSGSARTVGPLLNVTAVVTAFNGTRSGGAPTLLLHSRSSLGTTSVLIGRLVRSDRPGFGQMLDVTVPPLPGGQAISDFRTTIPRAKLPLGAALKKKFAKQRKKCKKIGNSSKRKRCLRGVNRKLAAAKKQFYVMARCKNRKWRFQAVSFYDAGAPSFAPAGSTTAAALDRCKQR